METDVAVVVATPNLSRSVDATPTTSTLTVMVERLEF